MSTQNRTPPRKPDLELDKCSAGAWDNRQDGGDFNVTIRLSFKDVTARLQEAKDNAHDGERPVDRKDERREAPRDDKRTASREDRRDTGPRYER